MQGAALVDGAAVRGVGALPCAYIGTCSAGQVAGSAPVSLCASSVAAGLACGLLPWVLPWARLCPRLRGCCLPCWRGRRRAGLGCLLPLLASPVDPPSRRLPAGLLGRCWRLRLAVVPAASVGVGWLPRGLPPSCPVPLASGDGWRRSLPRWPSAPAPWGRLALPLLPPCPVPASRIRRGVAAAGLGAAPEACWGAAGAGCCVPCGWPGWALALARPPAGGGRLPSARRGIAYWHSGLCHGERLKPTDATDFSMAKC